MCYNMKYLHFIFLFLNQTLSSGKASQTFSQMSFFLTSLMNTAQIEFLCLFGYNFIHYIVTDTSWTVMR